MPPVRNLRPGYTVHYPNREKASSHVTKAIVALILLISAGLILIITFGGWSKLQGLKPVNIIWALIYLICAFYIWRWNRGLLPISAALGILLLIIAVIAGLGVSGTSWFDRNSYGFAPAQSIFGGNGLSPDLLGALTLILIPVQVLLIVFAMVGFSQGWNVEQEIREDELRSRGRGGTPSRSQPATA
jgi:hypothetical protein